MDVNKTLEENQIKNKNTIVINIQKDKINGGNETEKKNNNKEGKDNKIKSSKINKDKENKGNLNNDKMSVIIEDENQKSYSLICKKNDIFSSLEIKLFEKDSSLKNKKHNYYVDNKKIDISKTLEQNNITHGTIIYYKIEENNEDEEISVIIRTTDQTIKYPIICKKNDKFKILEQKLYKKYPNLENEQHYYICNGIFIDIEKTIEENKIKESDQIIYNIVDIEENEDINVNIKSSNQNFEFSFKCKKSDKFELLEKKLYEKYPDLKNEKHYYLCDGMKIDIGKTIEENKIKDNANISFNIDIYDILI